jgi:hypothetical protein
MTESQKKAVFAALDTPYRAKIARLDVPLAIKNGLRQMSKRHGHKTLLAFLRKTMQDMVLEFWDQNPSQAEKALLEFKILCPKPAEKKEVKLIDMARVEEILEDPSLPENIGLFYSKSPSQSGWFGIDNMRGEAFLEEFGSKEYAIVWLQNPDSWDDDEPEPDNFL